MKKIFLLLLVIAVLVIASCSPTEVRNEELSDEEILAENSEQGSLAGQAVADGCKTYRVTSCQANSDGSISVRKNIGGVQRQLRPGDYCSKSKAFDYSCASPTSYKLCTTSCDNGCGGNTCQASAAPAQELPPLPEGWDLNKDGRIDRIEGDANLDLACAQAVFNNLRVGRFDAIRAACGNSLDAIKKIDVNCDNTVTLIDLDNVIQLFLRGTTFPGIQSNNYPVCWFVDNDGDGSEWYQDGCPNLADAERDHVQWEYFTDNRCNPALAQFCYYLDEQGNRLPAGTTLSSQKTNGRWDFEWGFSYFNTTGVETNEGRFFDICRQGTTFVNSCINIQGFPDGWTGLSGENSKLTKYYNQTCEYGCNQQANDCCIPERIINSVCQGANIVNTTQTSCGEVITQTTCLPQSTCFFPTIQRDGQSYYNGGCVTCGTTICTNQTHMDALYPRDGSCELKYPRGDWTAYLIDGTPQVVTGPGCQ